MLRMVPLPRCRGGGCKQAFAFSRCSPHPSCCSTTDSSALRTDLRQRTPAVDAGTLTIRASSIPNTNGKKSKEAERRETRSPRSAPFGARRGPSADRSPLGVPPRHSLQRTNATAQPQLRASWDGTRQERALPAPGRPAVQRSLDRRPVIVPAGRKRRGRPGVTVTNRYPREPAPAPP
jgi:hypothetical protein